jgi:hypothetical protein
MHAPWGVQLNDQRLRVPAQLEGQDYTLGLSRVLPGGGGNQNILDVGALSGYE